MVEGFVAVGLGWAQGPTFEVASVRALAPEASGLTSISPPEAARFMASNVPLPILIAMAYGVDSNRISGQPGWMETQRYDVNAKAEGDRGLTYAELRPMLKGLLEQRLKLAVHHEQKDAQGYALLVAKGGPKLQKAAGNSEKRYILPGGLLGENVPVAWLAGVLAGPAGRPVADRTGIEGNYDIKLDFARDPVADTSRPSVFTALQEQLGLKLETQRVPVDSIVIDHVERIPTEN